MAHTYTSCFVHCLFSTRHRRPLLTAAVRERLWPFLPVVSRRNGFRLMAARGSFDHIHVLLKIPSTLAVSKAVRILKEQTAAFIGPPFAWQDGYAAFTLSAAELESTTDYIRRQGELHSAKTFEEEYVGLLRKHGVRYDERYLFD